MPRQYTRRTAEQWLALVEAQQQSNLSAPRYCEQHNLGYASFCKWRQHFAASKPDENKVLSGTAPDFIDLSSMAAPVSGRWQITLSLGDGIELNLSRG